ncbi:guanylyl cyclase [Reticulomyxa filosa]|uniref:Guanylyl cyclase n=1 Tax=Reticulomyxa filosa TaxID=46433 RepID=X6MWH1_RETFI|nr:guanylyl cyclase [Reticulomyxa filosa]|eukprot:ETO17415.1 guanylyl cyclase [Reticulomyxa filosa]
MPSSVPSYGFNNNSNVGNGDASSQSSMSPSQKHKSGSNESNNPLEINIPEFKERFEKWMVDLNNSGRDMSCFFFDEEKGGIFCRICIEANKSGGFCTKPAQEQARRCLTKHLNREKHKSALQQLCQEGKVAPSMVIASGAAGLLEDDYGGDDRSDSNDDNEYNSNNNNNNGSNNNNTNNNNNIDNRNNNFNLTMPTITTMLISTTIIIILLITTTPTISGLTWICLMTKNECFQWAHRPLLFQKAPKK